MFRIAVDNRSILSKRVSGWERFAKELYAALSSTTREIELVPMYTQDGTHLTNRLRDFSVRKKECDLVFFPTFPPSPLISPRRAVYILYDLTWWKYPETASFLGRYYFKYLASLAIKRGVNLVTISETARAEIVEYFGLSPDQVLSIYPGLTSLANVESAPNNLNAREKPYFLFIGTVEPRKNLNRLVTAFQQSGLNESFDLVIVGRKAWGDLPAGVFHFENQTDVELALWYSRCHALVIPSLYEGFGLTIIEALSYGKRVVVSDIPVFREVAGDLGLYFDPLDALSIAKALRHCKEKPSSSFAQAAKKRAEQFSWNLTADSYEVYFERVARDL